MMGFIWFWLVAVMIVGYVVLDGFDLGVGVLHLFLVRTESERRATLASIGPVWDGNEVWLLAGGGTLYFAFPLLYYAYHIMAGLGTWFALIMLVAAFLLWRGRLYSARWALWALLLSFPLPYIANTAG